MTKVKHPSNRLQRRKLKRKDETKNEHRKAGQVWNKSKISLQEKEAQDDLRRATDRYLHFTG